MFKMTPDDFSFTMSYQLFIEHSVNKQLNDSDDILFKGWIDTFFIAIVDEQTELKFIFANVREEQRVYFLPVFINETGYKCFTLYNMKNFPKIFKKITKKRGLVFNNNYKLGQNTTVQRLITCCMYDINNLHVHHIDLNIEDNHINNLIPLYPVEHEDFHQNKYDIFSYSFDNSIKNMLPPRRDKFSKYKDNIRILIILYYRFILKYKIKDISLFYNIKPLSIATLNRVLAKFTDFKLYYAEINR